MHRKLVEGKAAPLRSQTQVSAFQILAIGLPDLEVESVAAPAEPVAPGSPDAPPEAKLPACMNLNIVTVINHLLIDPRARWTAHKRLEQYVENLRALGIVDEHGRHANGQMIRDLRGVDGPFVHYCLVNHELIYEDFRQLVEYLVDNDTVHKILGRRDNDKKREWIRNRLRERRGEESQVSWEDVEAEYDQKFPRELTRIEQIHQEFVSKVPHPELHGGKVQKTIWATMEEADDGFMDFVERHDLAMEEGNLFSYLARVMRMAKMLFEATQLTELQELETRIRTRLAVIDARILEELDRP